MADMLESQTTRSKRLTLQYLHEACQNLQKTQIRKGKTIVSSKRSDHFLEDLMRNIKVNKLAQYVTGNLLMNNVFGKQVDFQIYGNKQMDQQRIVQWQGVRINEKVLATIYILEIIFVLVTFVLSSFVAFLQGFRSIEYNRQGSMLALNVAAIIFSSCKMGTSITSKKIKDGIQLVYISDIFYDYVTSLVIFIDIAYLIMLIVLLVDGNNSVGFGVGLFVLCLVKLISCFSNFTVFETTFIKGFRNENYWKLVKTIVFNLGFAHFLASTLLVMATIDDQQNWLKQQEINDKAWWVQYMWAYYWATTIMMTIGFGDITATNHSEAVVLAFLQLFSCIVLAYNISQIGSVISALRSAGNEYQKKISIFKRMAQQDEIDVQLKTKIEGYLKQEREINQTYEFNQQSELLNSIPANLKKQYINQSNKKFFTYIPFFRNIRKTTLMKFTADFNGRVYYPGEYLLSLKENEQSIMILKQGKVGLTYRKQGSKLNGTIVQSIQIQEKMVHVQNDLFQKRSVPIILNTNFLNRTHKTNYEVLAETYSFAYSISYESFLSSLKQSDIDSSYYFSILHRTSISKNEWIQIQCDKCNQQTQISDELNIGQKVLGFHAFQSNKIQSIQGQRNRIEYHTKFQCPKLHFCPLKGIVILKTIKSKGKAQQCNINYKRKKQREIHSYWNKIVFTPLEEKINIKAKKRLEFMFNKDLKQSMHKTHSQDEEQCRKLGPLTLDSKEQSQALEKLIKKSLQQVIRGYQEGYWDLEIDVMNNFISYFPVDNASNFDNLPLHKGHSNSFLQNSSKFKSHVSQIDQFERNVQKNRFQKGDLVHAYMTKTKQIRILKTQESQQNSKYYFKRIQSPKAERHSENLMYSPQFNIKKSLQSDFIQDQDEIEERQHSIISSKSQDKLNKIRKSGL